MSLQLTDELTQLELPKSKLKQLQRKQLWTVQDLLNFLPLHYFDFSHPQPIAQLQADQTASVYVKIKEITGYPNRITVIVQDQQQQQLQLVFFHQDFIVRQFQRQHWYTVGGKVTRFRQQLQMVNPGFIQAGNSGQIVVQYSKIAGMSQNYLQKQITQVLQQVVLPENLETALIKRYQLLPLPQMYQQLHQPQSLTALKKAQRRWIYNQIFQAAFAFQRANLPDTSHHLPLPQGQIPAQIVQQLPYNLTSGQQQALTTITQALQAGKSSNFLLQGDVGSGKSIVSYLALAGVVTNGYQGALAAPTTVLAQQHAHDLTQLLAPWSFQVQLLTGETPPKKRQQLLTALKAGKIDILVGTHALMSPEVQFHNLALTVIDEEQKFGRNIKQSLINKALPGSYTLVTSATPLPGTLASSVYGPNLQTINLKTLPQGKKPIQSYFVTDYQLAFQRIAQEIAHGHQAYLLAPIIEQQEQQHFTSAQEVWHLTQDYFPQARIGYINGRLAPSTIQQRLNQFRQGELDILVTTTIIETGISVDNATVMGIFSPEKLGISQLHQIRGRVGRSHWQSYAYFITAAHLSDTAQAKLQALAHSQDAFYLSQVDLKLRGAGDLLGVGERQSGLNEYLDLVQQNPIMSKYINWDLQQIFKDPARLQFYDQHLN